MRGASLIDHFVEHGFVRIRRCFDTGPGSLAARWIERAWDRLGLPTDEPERWPSSLVALSPTALVNVPDFAPAAWQAITDLLGGPRRVRTPLRWADAFVMNFGRGEEQATAGVVEATYWHVDGDFFRHFLDSPEQALLTLVLWNDVGEDEGGTRFASDSIPLVAEFLAAHPEGVEQMEIPCADIARRCRHIRQATGEAGDVYLMHPFMLHGGAPNRSCKTRIMSNPVVQLAAPLRFDRTRQTSFSAVERAVLRGLGVRRLTFSATRERHQHLPERVALWERHGMDQRQKTR